MKKLLALFLLIPFASLKAQVNNKYWVGSGSGNLTVDASTYTYAAGDTIVVRSGTYETITFQNFTRHMTVRNDSAGPVIMDGTSDIYAGLDENSCDSVLVTRNPVIAATTPYGFICQNNSYRSTNLNGQLIADTLQWVEYWNIGDYNIFVSASTLIQWTGTNATLQGLNLAFLHCYFGGGSPGNIFQVQGSVSGSAITGLQRGFEIGYCVFDSVTGGILCFSGASDQYKIHDNTFNNINYNNNDDNGFFLMVGNGSFYNNYSHNYQGHTIRAWTMSFGTTVENVYLYNNISDSSSKYSPFEWQSTKGENIVDDTVAPYTTNVNIYCCNNIGGDINYGNSGSYDGCLVDDYVMPTASIKYVYNNFIYNTFGDLNGPAHRIFQFNFSEDSSTTDTARDWYVASAAAAGYSETTLYLTSGSQMLNAGVPGYLVSPTDFHNVAFNTGTPSIGAVSGVASTTSVTKFIAPLSLSAFELGSNATMGLFGANQMVAAAFYLPYQITLTTIGAVITTAEAGSTINLGIYNAAGTTKLIDSGPISGASTGYVTASVSSVVLAPGFYWCAYSGSNGSLDVTGWYNDGEAGIHVDANVYGTSSNATSGGVMPATLGAITQSSNNGPLIILN